MKVNACKCDRCGNLYIEDDEPMLKIKTRRKPARPDIDAGYDYLDLCPSCQEMMIETLKVPKRIGDF